MELMEKKLEKYMKKVKTIKKDYNNLLDAFEKSEKQIKSKYYYNHLLHTLICVIFSFVRI